MQQGGLGKVNIPILSDLTHKIAKDYGVYLDDLGHTLRLNQEIQNYRYHSKLSNIIILFFSIFRAYLFVLVLFVFRFAFDYI